MGRRIEKVTAAGSSIYVHDGGDVLEGLNGIGTVVARYTMGPGIDDPLAQVRNSVSTFYEMDGLGSVTSLTDPSGVISNTYGYDSFGVQTSSTGSVLNNFRYAAREFDPEIGLIYLRARYYDPSTGRFISEDPNVNEATLSLYSYVNNGAPNFVDPEGLGKKPPMPKPNFEPGVDNNSADNVTIGFHTAVNRVRGGGDCAKFFGTACDAEDKLKEMQWGVFTNKKRKFVMAHTTEDHMKTEFNTEGNFFGGDGYWSAPSSGDRYFLGGQSDYQAFIILHELAHHFPGTGFRPDGPNIPDSNAVNEANSLLLLKACFKDNRKMPK